MFRRTPAAPNPYADLLDEDFTDTQTIDPVAACAGDTAVIPRVEPEGPSASTGPATVVYGALDLTRSGPAPSPTPPLARPRRSHRWARGWAQTLRDVRRDPMSAIYLILIVVAAATTCWGTMVALRPEWVPPAINPRPVPRPSTQPVQYRPPQEPRAPQRPAQAPGTPTPAPSTAEPSPAPQEPTEPPSEPTAPPSPTPAGTEPPTRAPQTPPPPPAPDPGSSEPEPTEPPPATELGPPATPPATELGPPATSLPVTPSQTHPGPTPTPQGSAT